MHTNGNSNHELILKELLAGSCDDLYIKKIFELVKAIYGDNVPKREQWLNGWQWMYVNNPCGIAKICFAELGENLIGQYPIIPENIKIGNELIKAAQIVDTMTHPAYRNRGIAFNMGKKVLNRLNDDNISLLFGFPNEQAYPLHLRSGWLDVCAFQSMIRPINLEKLFQVYFTRSGLILDLLASGCSVIRSLLVDTNRLDSKNIYQINKFDDCINDFWNRVSNDYGILCIRNKEYLNWRYSDTPNYKFNIFVFEQNKKIEGYIVLGFHRTEGLSCAHIYDLIAPKDRFDVINKLVSNAISYCSSKNVDIISSKMVPNRVYKRALLKNGFLPSPRSNSRFIVYNNSINLSKSVLVDPKNWFIQSGDLPLVY